MTHPDKNKLITFYYREGTAREQHKLSAHIDSCESCQEYVQTLNHLGAKLAELPDEQPSSRILDNIFAEISVEKLRPARQHQFLLLQPIVKIAFALISILATIYFIQSQISLLPIWQRLSQYWLVQTIGSFGMVLILFFCIGTFITLSLAPILIMKAKTNGLNFERGVHLSGVHY